MQHLEKRKSIAKATTAAAIATDVATATDAKPQNRTGDKNCNSWKSWSDDDICNSSDNINS